MFPFHPSYPFKLVPFTRHSGDLGACVWRVGPTWGPSRKRPQARRGYFFYTVCGVNFHVWRHDHEHVTRLDVSRDFTGNIRTSVTPRAIYGLIRLSFTRDNYKYYELPGFVNRQSDAPGLAAGRRASNGHEYRVPSRAVRWGPGCEFATTKQCNGLHGTQ